jgi:hypothetical protein
VNVSDHDIGPVSPESLNVIVGGLDYACWKCGDTTTCIVAAHIGIGQSADWVWFEDKHALQLARELLLREGQVQRAATVKERFSKTAGDSYLSNGCEHCDAVQGDWSLGRAISDYALDEPLEELPILATAAVAEAAWRDVTLTRACAATVIR